MLAEIIQLQKYLTRGVSSGHAVLLNDPGAIMSIPPHRVTQMQKLCKTKKYQRQWQMHLLTGRHQTSIRLQGMAWRTLTPPQRLEFQGWRQLRLKLGSYSGEDCFHQSPFEQDF